MQLIRLLSDLPQKLSAEQFDQLVQGKHFRLERIISTGQVTPNEQWYDQDEDEWVLLLSGSAKLEFSPSQETISLESGDAVHIPAHTRHRVCQTHPTEPTVWLALHFQAAEE